MPLVPVMTGHLSLGSSEKQTNSTYNTAETQGRECEGLSKEKTRLYKNIHPSPAWDTTEIHMTAYNATKQNGF